MPSQSRSTRRPGDRAGLTPEQVTKAARNLANQHGPAALTMRRLAAELGVLPNALYSHIANKQALTDALVDALLGDVRPPDGDSWRPRLDGLLHATRDTLRREPAIAGMYLQRAGRGPNAVRLAELAAHLLREAGLDRDRAVEAFRVLLAYTVGFVAFETARTAGGGQDRPLPPNTDLDSRMAAPTSDRDFDLGLNWLLDGIASRHEQRWSHQGP